MRIISIIFLAVFLIQSETVKVSAQDMLKNSNKYFQVLYRDRKINGGLIGFILRILYYTAAFRIEKNNTGNLSSSELKNKSL